jgi:hypothetical protein
MLYKRREYIQTDWYKNLSKADQAKAENGFTDSLNDGAKNDGPIVPNFNRSDRWKDNDKVPTTAS